MLGNSNNPQRLNRYGYVLNDPINYLDPNGAEVYNTGFLIRVVRNQNLGAGGTMGGRDGYYGLALDDGFTDTLVPKPTLPFLLPFAILTDWHVSSDCWTQLIAFADAVQQFEPFSGVGLDLYALHLTLSDLENSGQDTPGTRGAAITSAVYGIAFNFGSLFLASNPATVWMVPLVGFGAMQGEMVILNALAQELNFEGENTLSGSEVLDQTNLGAFLGGLAALFSNGTGGAAFADQIIDACGVVDHEDED